MDKYIGTKARSKAEERSTDQLVQNILEADHAWVEAHQEQVKRLAALWRQIRQSSALPTKLVQEQRVMLAVLSEVAQAQILSEHAGHRGSLRFSYATGLLHGLTLALRCPDELREWGFE